MITQQPMIFFFQVKLRIEFDNYKHILFGTTYIAVSTNTTL